MFSECANPACEKPFDHHEGKFFRFPISVHDGEPPPNMHSVRHFWLCGDCSEVFTLSCRGDRGVVLDELLSHSGARDVPHLVEVA